MFSNMLAHVSLMRYIKSLVSRTCTHIPASVAKFCSQPDLGVNRTVWQTQIWKDKIWCFLLKKLDRFTGIE